jgi:pyruvate dehydrogenase E1 component beta subunit
MEEALPYLDKPLKRLAIPDVPIATDRRMAEHIVPSANAIESGVRDLVG